MDAPLLALLAGFTPQSSPPANPATNRVYLDDGSNTGTGNPGLMYWTGAAWADIGGSSSSVGVPEVVEQIVVADSAATTVTFSSPGSYDQWTIVVNAQAASSTGWVNLYFNGDTTANNYMRDINGTQQQNDPTCLIISTAGGFATINTQIGLDGRRHSRIENTYYDGSNATKHTLSQTHIPTSGGVASIALTAAAANNIAIGSTFTLLGTSFS